MKTTLSHLSSLHEPHATQAIANLHAEDTDGEIASMEYDRLRTALFNAFDWEHSPQGSNYWSDIYDSLLDRTYFDAPQLTPEGLKRNAIDQMFERLATEAEMEEMEETIAVKETNPKDSLGIKKVPLSGMPAPVLLECGLVKLHGDLKYGRYNWREAGVRASVYYDASIRHLMAWYEGEDIDPDSGVHHLAHAMTGLAVLRDSQMRGNCTDDRPMPSEDGWVSEMNEIAAKMIEKHK